MYSVYAVYKRSGVNKHRPIAMCVPVNDIFIRNFGSVNVPPPRAKGYEGRHTHARARTLPVHVPPVRWQHVRFIFVDSIAAAERTSARRCS